MSSKLGRPKNPPKPKEMLKDVLPLKDLFAEDELKLYQSLVDIYLADFEGSDLSSSDVDDIMNLAMNRVFEIRLMKSSKDNPMDQLNVSAAMERLKKQDEKIKESLSARRKDRIDPNEYKGFSIVDLAVAFDSLRKQELEEKATRLRKEQQVVLDKRKDYTGNKYDQDNKDK